VGVTPQNWISAENSKINYGETLQSESSDGGKTWTMPRSIGVWGFPSHLLKLKDGRLLMTYGYVNGCMRTRAHEFISGVCTKASPTSSCSMTSGRSTPFGGRRKPATFLDSGKFVRKTTFVPALPTTSGW
jgi:hypothetical protein